MWLDTWFRVPSAGNVIKGELYLFFSGSRNLRPRRTVVCCRDGYFSALLISCKKHLEEKTARVEKGCIKEDEQIEHGRNGKTSNVSKKKFLQGFYVHGSYIPQLDMCLFLLQG